MISVFLREFEVIFEGVITVIIAVCHVYAFFLISGGEFVIFEWLLAHCKVFIQNECACFAMILNEGIGFIFIECTLENAFYGIGRL